MNRREMLTSIAKGAAVTTLPGIGSAGAAARQPGAGSDGDGCSAAAGTFPNVLVRSHENREALFYRDLIQGKTVMINFMSIAGEAANPVTASLAEVQRALGDRLGRDAFMYSITVDPEHDSPRALRDFAARHGARPGWLFLTGEPATIEVLHRSFFAHPGRHGAAPVEDCSLGIVRYGNDAVGLWGSAPARSNAAWLAARLSWVATGSRVEGPPRRRGPAPLALLLAGLLAASLAGGAGSVAAATASSGASAGTASGTSPYRHPHPQGSPPRSTVTTSGDTTKVSSGASLFAPSKPFLDPPGTNFLPTIYTDLFDSAGNSIPNTLPSTPRRALQPARRRSAGELNQLGLAARRPGARLGIDREVCERRPRSGSSGQRARRAVRDPARHRHLGRQSDRRPRLQRLSRAALRRTRQVEAGPADPR
ncbi:MAG TPA: SCO family protein [Thermoanaerobaculia bacterium]|nr:SCO family protein [Thermoanaerobaculia bacterium]